MAEDVLNSPVLERKSGSDEGKNSNEISNAVDDDGEMPVCRICRMEGTTDAPLYNPCNCTGTIRFIHQDCLLQWLKHSQKSYCELCKREFQFKPVYRDGTPPKLALDEFLIGLLSTFRQYAKIWGRYTLVIFCWGIVLPIIARWTWRCFFEEWVLPWNHDDPIQRLAWDCAEGAFVGVLIFCLALGILGLRDFIVAHDIPIADPLAILAQENLNQANGLGRNRANDDDNLANIQWPLIPDLPDIAAAAPGAISDDEDDDSNLENGGSVVSESEAEDTDTDDENTSDGSSINHDEVNEEEENENNEVEQMVEDFVGRVDAPQNNADNDNWHLNEDMPLEEILGLHGPLSQLFDNLLWITIMNVLAILFFAFLPCQLGVIISILLGDTKEPGLVSGFIGYLAIVIVAMLYLAFQGKPRSSSTRMLSFFSNFIKVCALFFCEVVVCPILAGWWLDICSLQLQTATLADLKQFHNLAPYTSSFLHWLTGMLFMHSFSSFVITLREILRPGVLWFFRDPNDPDFHPVTQMLQSPILKCLRRLVAVSMMYGFLIVMLVWLPVNSVLFMAPSLLPYNLHLTHPVEFLGLNLGLPLLQTHQDVVLSAKSILTHVITKGASVVGLSAYLLPHPPTEAPNEAQLKPRFFVLRIVAFLCINWAIVHVLVTLLLSVPILCGRYLASFLVSSKVNELYTFSIGVTIFLLLIQVTLFLRRADVSRHFSKASMRAAILRFAASCTRACKVCIAGLLLGFILPMLCGVLLDLTLSVPVKTQWHMTPVLNLWQDWAVGLMIIKCIHEAGLPGAPRRFAANMRIVDNNGVRNIQLKPIFEVATPLLSITLTLLSVPYVFAFGIYGGYLKHTPREAMVVYHCSFPAILLLIVGFYTLRQTYTVMNEAYNRIRDDKYLVGKRLLNVNNQQPEPTPT
eukprot:m.17760 g.17760  ORF g.17760 m.17760 type:complete len:916 (+) comp6103_c0_seq1:166-2913(+)